MKQTIKKNIVSIAVKSIEQFAKKKANSNCFGLMYEPKKPDGLVKK